MNFRPLPIILAGIVAVLLLNGCESGGSGDAVSDDVDLGGSDPGGGPPEPPSNDPGDPPGNPPAGGASSWIWADTHVHNRCADENDPDASEQRRHVTSSEDLVDKMIDENLQVSAALLWGGLDAWTKDRVHFTGNDDPASLSDRILHYDLEVSTFPAARLGHLGLFGLHSVDFSATPYETPRSTLPIVPWALAQDSRVVTGMDHGQFWHYGGEFPHPDAACCQPYEFPIHVALGYPMFLEFEAWPDPEFLDGELFSGLYLWRTLLNSGFRIPLLGASDYPCLSDRIGISRTRARIEGPLTYESFLDAVRFGRTIFVETGTGYLDLAVGGAGIGDELDVSSGSAVDVEVETNLAAPSDVSILVNGIPVDTVPMGAGASGFTRRLVLVKSSWIAAHAEGIVTSPVYVTVDGAPIRASADDTCYLVRYVDYLTGLVLNGTFDLGDEAAETLAAYEAARAVFVQRFGEAGGTLCLPTPLAAH